MDYYSGYGGMGGGMGGQNQSMMMSSALMASVCLSVLAAGGFYLMNNQAAAKKKADDDAAAAAAANAAAAAAASSTTTNTSTSLDGSFAILIGSLGLSVDGDCNKSSNITFRTPSDAKTVWNIRQAGTDASGENYYTLQSVFRSFNKICPKQFLTAPLGCKSGPFLDQPRYSPSQYFYIRGSAEGGYVIQNVACKMSRFEQSYVQASGQRDGEKPIFSGRTGSAFAIQKPFTG